MSSRRNQTESLAIKHVDPELWRWLKARATLEGKRQGQLLSELIERYWKEVGWSEENLPVFLLSGTLTPSTPFEVSTGSCGNG